VGRAYESGYGCEQHKDPAPGPNARRWVEYHRRYAARSTYHEGFVWDRSKPAVGPFCTDVDGNVILDFVSHVASSALGYKPSELVRLTAKLRSSIPTGTRDAISSRLGGGPGEERDSYSFASPLQAHGDHLQFGFGSAFFSNSGAGGRGDAIKICYDHKKNNGYGFASMAPSTAAPWERFP